MAPRQEASGPAGWRMATIIGNLLRTGVLLSAAIVLCGAVVYLVHHGGQKPEYRVFHGEPPELRSLTGIVAGTFQFPGRGIIQLGFLLLIATPVLRVAACWIAFMVQRDWLYVAVSLVVLGLLTYSLAVGSL